MKQIFFIMIGLSVSLWAELSRDDTTQIVTDNSTGLQWQDDVIIKLTWIQSINYCESLSLGGNSDWRLPNINELYSIVDLSTSNPAISSIFQNTGPLRYVTSTAYYGNGRRAFYVNFAESGAYWYAVKFSSFNIRCVRD